MIVLRYPITYSVLEIQFSTNRTALSKLGLTRICVRGKNRLTR